MDTVPERKLQTVEEYWSGRQNMIYYNVVEIIAEHLSRGASSMIDVGSAGGDFIGKFASVPNKTSLDMHYPYDGNGTTPVKADFFDWQPDKNYDVVMCLQVLEHIPDATKFAQKLLGLGGIVIASVPYKWKKGGTISHVHDPVDETKMLDWFGRKPNYSHICTEPRNAVQRLIHVYDQTGVEWPSLKHRDRILTKGARAPTAPRMRRSFKDLFKRSR